MSDHLPRMSSSGIDIAELIDPSRYHHKHAEVNGRTYHYVDEPAQGKEKATLLLLHGFPDLFYGWRYQIKPWARMGYRVIVPSQLGYWTSSKPDDISKYSFKSTAADNKAILDQANVQSSVIVIGHDWGGMIAWRFCQYFPDAAVGVISFCTPLTKIAQPNSKLPTHEEAVEQRLPNFGYQTWFKTDEAAELLQRNLAGFLGPSFARPASDRKSKRMNTPGFKPSTAELKWVLPGEMRKVAVMLDESRKAGKRQERVDDPELKVYYDAFQKSDIKHALNWYKTWTVNLEEEAASCVSPNFPAHIPALFFPATFDAALTPAMAQASMRGRFPGGVDVRLQPNADHWLLQDVAIREKLVQEVADWIEQKVLKTPSKL